MNLTFAEVLCACAMSSSAARSCGLRSVFAGPSAAGVASAFAALAFVAPSVSGDAAMISSSTCPISNARFTASMPTQPRPLPR